jgi:ribose transport system ATP-binding protein
LDEPTASISDKETQNLFGIVRKLKEKGIGIIYISHRLSELFEIGDRVTVMRDGEYVSTVNLKDTNIDELTKMMVGRKVEFTKITNTALQEDKTVLEVRGICYKDLLKNVSLGLRKGEILGISGLIGSGRTELAKCIIGAYKASCGEVMHNNRRLKPGSIAESIKSGIVYLSEDRKDEGLVLMHSVMDNIVLPNLKYFGKVLLNKSKMLQASRDYIKRLRVKTPSHLTEAKNLSGGNQQKLVIAKWVFSKADIYIFDEPTRGIDVGAREEIYNIMQELVQNGASIIMISSDLVEILKMCDRVVVMKQGEITGTLENDENLTQETILSYALHGGKSNE